MKGILIFLLVGACSVCFAGRKSDFIQKVQKTCKLDEKSASKLATPGRQGNVIKLSLCSTNPVDLGANCKVKCSTSSGNVVGN
jgi:hypothetical protein